MKKEASSYKENIRGIMSKAMICFLGVFTLHTACIEELDTQIINTPNLVINGQFNNSEGLRQLSVNLILKPDGSGEKLAASGSIYKDGQLSVELVRNSNNDLALPLDYVIEAGSEYFTEVTLPDGQIYRSVPQLVSPTLETDSVSFAILDENPVEWQPGDPIVSRGIEIFAHIMVPKQEDGKRFYRWVVDESWSFVESNKTDTCYIQESIRENPFTIYSNISSNTEIGDVKVPILKHPLDKTFAAQHYINTYLHSIDQATFEYYEKVERIAGSSGTLYDEVPGPIEGNVFKADNPEVRIAGWVEFFLADTLRLRIRRRNISVNIPKQCDDVPGGGPCKPGAPCPCLACEIAYGTEAKAKPDYWVD